LLLAPSEEQRRVVAKVEDLLSKVHSSKKRLDRVSTILKRFRQSIVAAACAGQLTEDWRTRNLDSSNADVTVAGIRRRRESAAMTLAQKERIKAIYQEAEEQDSDTLPTNWRSVRLNKLCGSFDYGTSAKSQPSGKMPVLRMGNIQDGKIDWTDLVYTSNDYEIQSYALRPNTVLFNRTNSPELVGKTALYRGDRPAIFAGYLIRINNEPELDAEYLNLCLNTSYAREFCRSVKTDGVSQSNINAQKLGAFEVPFCPIEEQREIVARVKKLSGLADRLQARFENSRAQVDRLTQSILAKAFRGELVPTEAELARREGREYETAEQLLSRIGCATKACSSNDRSRRVTRAKRT
jgi:type I restriction enzyme S subunit